MAAIESDTAGDATYLSTEHAIQVLTVKRDQLATQIKDALNAAAFDNVPLDDHQAQDLTDQANALIAQATTLGG